MLYNTLLIIKGKITEKKLKKLAFHVKGARIISKTKDFSITMSAKANQARLYYPLDLKGLSGM
jgi:hypothetical protein